MSPFTSDLADCLTVHPWLACLRQGPRRPTSSISPSDSWSPSSTQDKAGVCAVRRRLPAPCSQPGCGGPDRPAHRAAPRQAEDPTTRAHPPLSNKRFSYFYASRNGTIPQGCFGPSHLTRSAALPSHGETEPAPRRKGRQPSAGWQTLRSQQPWEAGRR